VEEVDRRLDPVLQASLTDGDEPMDETLNKAIDVLGQLQFETGGSILDHVVALKTELVAERQRRLDNSIEQTVEQAAPASER
jgi:hypothetical protein